MKKLLFSLVFLISLAASGQSESHDFITYDTTFNIGYANLSYIFRITRPKNLFVTGSPDTAYRPAIINMNGAGQVGTNAAITATYGPHYFLANGWNGGVSLGNGIHFPLIITVQPIAAWPQTHELLTMLKYLIKTYRINPKAVHLSGFSMGGMAWTALICHQEGKGTEDGMKLVTSIVALQGVSNAISAAQQQYQLGGSTSWTSFGHWAKKYGGKFFGLEGTADYRGLFQVQKPMNDSMSGSAYTQFENISAGGAAGSHCCWNAMYDPSVIDWTSTNKNIQPNTLYPGTLGTYFKGENIFQWQLRQGDTTLVAASAPPPPNKPPVANAGAPQTITLPLDSAKLDCSASYDPDGTIAVCGFSLISGPSHPNWTGGNVVSKLVPGVYTFQLSVTDNQGASSTAQTTVTVLPGCPPPRTAVSIQITINGLLFNIPLAGAKITYSDGVTQ